MATNQQNLSIIQTVISDLKQNINKLITLIKK